MKLATAMIGALLGGATEAGAQQGLSVAPKAVAGDAFDDKPAPATSSGRLLA